MSPCAHFPAPPQAGRRRGSSEKGSSYTCKNKTNSFITSLLLSEFSSTLPKLKGQERKRAKVLVDQEVSHWESRLYWKTLALIKEPLEGADTTPGWH